MLPSARYTVISGTPEKILEHFLETMRMDTHHSEPGTRPPARTQTLAPTGETVGSGEAWREERTRTRNGSQDSGSPTLLMN